MAGGRPRTVSPQPEALIALGEEMLEWVEANKPLHLSHWWKAHAGISPKQWETIIRREEFIPYYDLAIAKVSRAYLDGTVHPSLSQRFLRIYFKDVAEEEDATAEFNAKLKAQEQSAVSEADVERYQAVMNQLKSMQSDQ